MNYVIDFPAWRRPYRLTLPESDLGSFGSPIKLFFSQVVVIWTWGHGLVRWGLWVALHKVLVSDFTSHGRCMASSGPLFHSNLQIVLLAMPGLRPTPVIPAVPSMMVVVTAQ